MATQRKTASHRAAQGQQGGLDLDRSFAARAKFGGSVAVILFGLLLARVWQVQHIAHPSLVETSRKLKEDPILAGRGTIFDVNRRTLAYDEMFYEVMFDNYVVRARSHTAKEIKDGTDRMSALAAVLAKAEGQEYKHVRAAWTDAELQERYLNWLLGLIGPVLQKTPAELRAAIAKKADDGQTSLSKELNLVQHTALQKIIEEHKPVGLLFQERYKRINPMAEDLSHVIGWVRSEPTNGVELFRNKDLAGTEGKWVREVSTKDGMEVPGPKSELVKPIRGNSLRLTLDYDLQLLMEESLREKGRGAGEIYVPDLNCERAILLILDAKTLAIRSVVCQNKDDAPGMPGFNMAFDGCWDPGSIMKIVTVAGALETGHVTPNTEVNVYGGVYQDRDVDKIEDEHPFDTLSVSGILVHSSNIGAFQMARTVGIRQWGPLLEKFGFGKKTGIDSRAETPGIVPKHDEWINNTLARSSYGYNIGVSPLQMCSALGVLLNDGVYRKPYLVEELLTEKGETLQKHQQEEGTRCVSPKTAKQMREMMLNVVEDGTGKTAQSAYYWTAGKTATARYATREVDAKGKKGAMGYAEGNYAVSFLGYAPADEPKLIGLVLLVQPKAEANRLYGSALAAPVWRRCMERALRFYEVPEQEVSHRPAPKPITRR